eukprot:118134-Alexandrium_andersonii.AAC.1
MSVLFHKSPGSLGLGQQWKVGDGPCSGCHTMVLLVHHMATHAATRRDSPLPPRARCVRVVRSLRGSSRRTALGPSC